MNWVHACLHTAQGQHPLRLRLADRFASRLRGLMFQPPLRAGEGLLILRCASVHTAFVRASIDVAYLDASGLILHCVPRLGPWRASVGGGWWGARDRHALELAAGSIHRLGLRPGDRLGHAGWTGAERWA